MCPPSHFRGFFLNSCDGRHILPASWRRPRRVRPGRTAVLPELENTLVWLPRTPSAPCRMRFSVGARVSVRTGVNVSVPRPYIVSASRPSLAGLGIAITIVALPIAGFSSHCWGETNSLGSIAVREGGQVSQRQHWGPRAPDRQCKIESDRGDEDWGCQTGPPIKTAEPLRPMVSARNGTESSLQPA